MLPSAVDHFGSYGYRLSSLREVFCYAKQGDLVRLKMHPVYTEPKKKMYTFSRLFQPNTKASLFWWGGFGSPNLYPVNKMTTAPNQCRSSYPSGIAIQNKSLDHLWPHSISFYSRPFYCFFSWNPMAKIQVRSGFRLLIDNKKSQELNVLGSRYL